MKQNKDTVHTLCCGKNKCPQVTIDKKTGDAKLTDDFGGKVILEKVQFDLLKKKIKDGSI
jgi:hypothetical protein